MKIYSLAGLYHNREPLESVLAMRLYTRWNLRSANRSRNRRTNATTITAFESPVYSEIEIGNPQEIAERFQERGEIPLMRDAFHSFALQAFGVVVRIALKSFEVFVPLTLSMVVSML